MTINNNWINQGRQEHGWFGHGTSAHSTGTAGSGTDPDSDSARATRARDIVHGAVGHLRAALRRPYESYLSQGGLAALTETLHAWSGAPGRDRDAFRDRFLPVTTGDTLTDHLRGAAKGVAGDGSRDGMRAASAALAAAADTIGTDRLPRFVAEAHARAATRHPAQATQAPIVQAQLLGFLTPKPPFVLAEPPKIVVPRNMQRIPNQSGKEAASNVPDWAHGNPRRVGETPESYARRVMDEQYGPGNWWKKGPGTEFGRIKKHGQRAYRDPKEIDPAFIDDAPEA